MNTKTLAQVKAGDRGEVSAVFSTFDVVDSDGDVTLPTAFDRNSEVPISAYGHSSWGSGVPVGKGTIRTTDREAVLEGQFFMDTAAGRDTFNAIKGLGELGQWSYGFEVLEAEPGRRDGRDVQMLKRMKVHEVSPVLVGAGVNTRTLAAKIAKEGGEPVVTYKAAIRPHDTATTNREWDGPAVVAAISDDASVSDLRSVHAWADGGADPETKAAYKFPHHHGVDGPANIRACVAGIAALNGARGGADVPDDDRQGIYEHLAAHLRDADREPPELRSNSSEALKFQDDLLSVWAEVQRVNSRFGEIRSLRSTKGKRVAPVNVEVMAWLLEDALKCVGNMQSYVNRPREQAALERARFIAQQFRGENQ